MSTGTKIIKEWELKQDRGGFRSYKESMEWVDNKIDAAIKEAVQPITGNPRLHESGEPMELEWNAYNSDYIPEFGSR